MGTELFLVDFIILQANIQSVIVHRKFAALATEQELFGELRNMNGGEMKMNRELLFRGFHPCDGPDTIVVDGEKVKGRWVEGYYYNGKDGDVILSHPRDYGYADADRVFPSTVSQYTGLTDKNGKRIFELDILKTNKHGHDDGEGHNSAGADVFRVIFEDGGYCLKNKWRRFNLRPDIGAEVIGTVFDHEES